MLLPFYYRGIPIVTECFSFQVDWGEASMIRAERILLKHAFADPFNVRFLFLSDRCALISLKLLGIMIYYSLQMF